MFLLGTETRFTDGAGAAEFLRAAAAASRSSTAQRARLPAARRRARLALRAAQRIEGYNISIGKRVVMTLFRSAARHERAQWIA